MMKRLLFLLLCSAAFAQGVRYDLPPILNSRGQPIPNAQITLCTGVASISGSNCTGTAQSFTDITLGTACTAGLPVTLTNSNLCQATGDAIGNAGFWLSSGAYIYCINAPSTTGKCYNLSVPVGVTTGGTATITVGLTAPSFNRIAYVDGTHYACTAAGVNAAITDVNNALNGLTALVDASGCGGMNFGTTTIVVGPGPGIWLKLSGTTTCTSTAGNACINLNSEGGAVIGSGVFQTRLRINNATGDGIQVNQLFTAVRDLTVDSLVTRTAGAGIHILAGLGAYENLRIERTFYGILLDTSTTNGLKAGNNSISSVTMASGGFATGNWQSGLYVGANDIAANSVADTHVRGLRISLDLPFAGAGIELNGGTDSFDCMMCSIGGPGVGNDSKDVWIHNSNSNNSYPRYTRFANSYFESGPTKDAITINGGNNLDFVNSYAANAHWALLINPDNSTSIKGFHYLNGILTTTQVECVFIGGTPTNSDIQINYNQITDCSGASNNTSDNVFVSAPTVGLQLIGNDFHSVTGQVNQARTNINIAAGASDRYTVTGNSFGNNGSGSMLDGGTGTNRWNGPNFPLTPTTDFFPIGRINFPETTNPSGLATFDQFYADSTLHGVMHADNNTTYVPLGSRAILTADWTCGTGGTVASCTSATIIGSGGGVPWTFSLPLVANSLQLDCSGVVSQATAATANQWNLLTATNGATNVTATYDMFTAATASAAGAVTDQASTTTTFQISPSWTLGATGTKMPFHIHAAIEAASASGTVLSVQLLAPTVADLVTIFRGSGCWIHP